MKSLIFFTITSLCINLRSEILFPAQSISEKEFRSYLQAHPNLKSFSEYFFTNQKHSPYKQKLIEIGKQFHLQNKNDKSWAHLNLSSLQQIKNNHHWGEQERKLIFSLLIRMAAQESNPNIQKSILVEAFNFTTEFSLTHLNLPKLNTKFKILFISTKKQLNYFLWFPTNDFLKYTTLYINGRPISLKPLTPIKLPYHTSHYVFVSDKYKPITFKIKARDWPKSISPIAFVEGHCQKFTLNTNYKASKIYLSKTCIKTPHKSTQIVKSKYSHKTLKPLLQLTNPKKDINPYFKKKVTLKKSSSLLSNKWFWLGSALVGGYIIHSQQPSRSPSNSHKNSTPTTAYDY